MLVYFNINMKREIKNKRGSETLTGREPLNINIQNY